jgi:hypothetical protein
MRDRIWNGLHIYVNRRGEDVQRPVVIEMKPEDAAYLSGVLENAKVAHKAIRELMDALNYTIIGDPGSVGAYRRLLATKGMEPASGDPRSYADGQTSGKATVSYAGQPITSYLAEREPEETDPPGHIFVASSTDGRRCSYGARGDRPHEMCWKTREEHSDGA